MKLFLSILLVFIDCEPANAHGMDSLGPNKGFIQMPGAFHTELVIEDDWTIRVYLLDMEFKNPVVKDSGVRAEIKILEKVVPLDCSEFEFHFRCAVPRSNSSNSNANDSGPIKRADQITIHASRLGALAGSAVYKLPLKLGTKGN